MVSFFSTSRRLVASGMLMLALSSSAEQDCSAACSCCPNTKCSWTSILLNKSCCKSSCFLVASRIFNTAGPVQSAVHVFVHCMYIMLSKLHLAEQELLQVQVLPVDFLCFQHCWTNKRLLFSVYQLYALVMQGQLCSLSKHSLSSKLLSNFDHAGQELLQVNLPCGTFPHLQQCYTYTTFDVFLLVAYTHSVHRDDFAACNFPNCCHTPPMLNRSCSAINCI